MVVLFWSPGVADSSKNMYLLANVLRNKFGVSIRIFHTYKSIYRLKTFISDVDMVFLDGRYFTDEQKQYWFRKSDLLVMCLQGVEEIKQYGVGHLEANYVFYLVNNTLRQDSDIEQFCEKTMRWRRNDYGKLPLCVEFDEYYNANMGHIYIKKCLLPSTTLEQEKYILRISEICVKLLKINCLF